jgi:hypothetical protein
LIHVPGYLWVGNGRAFAGSGINGSTQIAYSPVFEIASERGLSSPWEGVPNEAFMVLILDDTIMAGVSGIVRYRDEFNEAM